MSEIPSSQNKTDEAAEQFIPPELSILKEKGWSLENNKAYKVIDQSEICIDLARIGEKGKAVEIAGYPYEFGLKPELDLELKTLFVELGLVNKNGTEKPQHKPVPKSENSPNENPEKTNDVQETSKSVKSASTNLVDYIKSYVGNDVLEIFGDTGTGKSKFCLEVARQAIAGNKTVFYLDTERNLTEEDIASLKGCQYKYTPVLDEIDKIVLRELPKVDVVIIDSIGFPVLTSYARLNLKQKGDALLKLIAIFGDLKTWAYRNNGLAIVSNQPESDFNKEPGHVLRPFGDKSQFAAKEIWKTDLTSRNQGITKIAIKAFRSRSLGHGAKIANMEITGAGVRVQEANS